MNGWRVLSLVLSALALLPVLAGLAGVVLPAFGHFPALGRYGPSAEPLLAVLDAPGIARSVLLSALTGLLATLLSVALTAAILAATYGSAALRLVERALAPILAVPHAAAALGVVVLFAPSGLIVRALSPFATGWDAPPDVTLLRDPLGLALTAGLVVKETPFLFLMALAALPQAKAREHVAIARSFGYGRMAAFLHTAWPLVYRQLRLPILAVLAFAASVVDMALILGPTRPPPLSVRIVDWLGSARLDAWLVGCAAALLLGLLVVALIVLWQLLERLLAGLGRLARDSGRRLRHDAALRCGLIMLAAVSAALMFAGFGGLVLQSVAGYWPFPDALPQSVSFAAWRRGGMILPVLSTTLIVAAGATLISLPVAIALLEAARRGARVPAALYLPLIVPQVAFLFGLNVIAIAAGVTPGIGAVIAAHAVFTLPYALIALSGPWASLDPRYEALAAALGAPPWRRFVLVRLPMLCAPLAVAAALAMAVSAGLYLPTQLVGGGRVATVTTEAVSAAVGGDRRVIGLYATLQLALPLAAFTLARLVPAALFADRRAMRADGSPP